MKTISVQVDDATWSAAQQAATAQDTTVDSLLREFLNGVGSRHSQSGEDQRALARQELVRALAGCDAEIGDRPTRERTYRDRRIH